MRLLLIKLTKRSKKVLAKLARSYVTDRSYSRNQQLPKNFFTLYVLLISLKQLIVGISDPTLQHQSVSPSTY